MIRSNEREEIPQEGACAWGGIEWWGGKSGTLGMFFAGNRAIADSSTLYQQRMQGV